MFDSQTHPPTHPGTRNDVLSTAMTTKPIKTLLARALYDNQSEFPTELAFRRGDVVTVLERDPGGYEGWWICSLRGKIGIAPGNRFEVLGMISKGKADTNTDLYDDPREWVSNNDPSTLGLSGPQQPITISPEQTIDTYENLDTVKPCNRTSGLTDSGNYSNRSSDVSLSLQSMTGATLIGVSETKTHRKTPDSQFEDYEDLDFDTSSSCKIDFDWPTRALPPVPQVHQNPNRRFHPTAIRPSNPVNESRPVRGNSGSEKDGPAPRCSATLSGEGGVVMLSGGKPSLDRLVTVAPGAQVSPVCPESRNVRTPDLESLSLVSNDSLECTNDGEILRTGFLKDQQDILAALRSRPAFVKFLGPIKQRLDAQSKRALSLIRAERTALDAPALTFSLTKLLQELIVVSQTCGMLTTSSKESPDTGLTRKLLLLRKTAEDVTTRLRGIVAELDIQGAEARQLCNPKDLERLLLLISQTVDSLDTTVLANASLLFSPTKILRRTNSSYRTPNSEQSSIEHCRNLSNSVPQLNQLSEAELNAGLRGLRSLNPQQMDVFRDGLRSLHEKCQTSLTVAQQFLEGLKTNEWSPTNNRIPRTLLTPNFLTLQVKATLHQSSLLIRAIAEFCSTVSSFQPNRTDVTTQPEDLCKFSAELENRGSAVCEALKGLVIQTKEATRHLQNVVLEKAPRDPHSTLPIPGPLWQRLLGSSRSVCLALTTLNKLLDSYLVIDSDQVSKTTRNT